MSMACKVFRAWIFIWLEPHPSIACRNTIIFISGYILQGEDVTHNWSAVLANYLSSLFLITAVWCDSTLLQTLTRQSPQLLLLKPLLYRWSDGLQVITWCRSPIWIRIKQGWWSVSTSLYAQDELRHLHMHVAGQFLSSPNNLQASIGTFFAIPQKLVTSANTIARPKVKTWLVAAAYRSRTRVASVTPSLFKQAFKLLVQRIKLIDVVVWSCLDHNILKHLQSLTFQNNMFLDAPDLAKWVFESDIIICQQPASVPEFSTWSFWYMQASWDEQSECGSTRGKAPACRWGG